MSPIFSSPISTSSSVGQNVDETKLLRTLIIDNYDSYTFNLLHLWFSRPHLQTADSLDNRIILIRNDQYSWPVVRDKILPYIDNIVISPGPGTPAVASDFGVCTQILKEVRNKPIFGVCLGHQGIAHIFGHNVVKGQAAVHGQLSPLRFMDSIKSVGEANTVIGKHGSFFEGIPENIRVVRYHSLIVSAQDGIMSSNEGQLQVTAFSHGTVRVRDPATGQFHNEVANEIMALQHKEYPIYGVQFHPESICTEYGRQMMNNFHKLSVKYLKSVDSNVFDDPVNRAIPDDVLTMSILNPSISRPIQQPIDNSDNKFKLFVTRIKYPGNCNPAKLSLFLFEHMYGQDSMGFMLDSAKLGDLNSNVTIMGSGMDAGSATIRYRLSNNKAQVLKFRHSPARYSGGGSGSGGSGNISKKIIHESVIDPSRTSFWDWVQQAVDHTQAQDKINIVTPVDSVKSQEKSEFETSQVDELPFAFRGGWIGHFTYEMKAESLPLYSTQSQPHGGEHLAKQQEQQQQLLQDNQSGDQYRESRELPDVNLIFANHSVVVKFLPGNDSAEIYLQALATQTTTNINAGTSENPFKWVENLGQSEEKAQEWLMNTRSQVERLVSEFASTALSSKSSQSTLEIQTEEAEKANIEAIQEHIAEPVSALTYDEYISAVEKSQEWIREGESYEVCLTTQFRINLEQPIKSDSLSKILPSSTPANSDKIRPVTAAIKGPGDMRELYKSLRHFNPAPYACYFWFGDMQGGIAGSSPERFLRVTTNLNIKSMDSELIDTEEAIWNEHQNIPLDLKNKRWVEMKPIKGTVRRPAIPNPCPHGTMLAPVCEHCENAVKAQDKKLANILYHDVKERAENLMIVDLIRNDLTTFCDPNSVCVPHLMAIETYAHVHQMVTTVCGRLRDDVGGITALDKCFPPGSMTGAPKLRTVQLLECLETEQKSESESTSGVVSGSDISKFRIESSDPSSFDRKPYPRGIYSGCIGYISSHGGQSDWSVVIRTLVVDHHGTRLTAGAGGALTILSDPQKEWEEVLVKFGSIYPGIKNYLANRVAESIRANS
ncbi:para-aminobenzoate synthase, (PABA) [Mycoemilia scoparia]|uniref:aminodeoxychorismate synthase n=1 Tax=Mycoemilia scoparia TaxID=417184 RepID=A0A9W8DSA3_9FUNG|nr:para-aminobenzoate synthase, (PABA) [Mycoemilia scoparia]